MNRKKVLLEYNQATLDKLTNFYKSRQGGAGEYIDREIIQDSYLKKMERLINIVRKAQQTLANANASDNEKNLAQATLNKIPEKLLEKNRYVDINNWIRPEYLPADSTPWNTLETFVDSFEPSRGEQRKAKKAIAKDLEVQVTNADEIYNKDQLEIFEGSTQKSCIKYGTKNGKVQYYSWCIGATGPRTMYHNYRFGRGKMFYYVFDKTRVDTESTSGEARFVDSYHAIVIHVYKTGEFGLTLADNKGDRNFDDWESLCASLPSDLGAKLLPLQSLFKYVPPSQEEVELEALGGKALSYEDFSKLRYETQAIYVGNQATRLDSNFFSKLPTSLKKVAINEGRICTFNELKDVPELLRWYPEYRFTRFPDEPLPIAFLPYLRKASLQEKYFEEFGKDVLGFYEVDELFPGIVEDYVKNEVASMNPLPEAARKYMDDKTEQLYNFYSPIYANLEYPKVDLDKASSLTKARPLVTPADGFVTYRVYAALSPEAKARYVDAATKIAKSSKTRDFEILNTYAPLVIEIGDTTVFAIEDEDYNIQIFTTNGTLITDSAEELSINGKQVLPPLTSDFEKYYKVSSPDDVTYVDSKGNEKSITNLRENKEYMNIRQVIQKLIQEALSENAPVKAPVKPGEKEKTKNPNAPSKPGSLPKPRPKAKVKENSIEDLQNSIIRQFEKLKGE